MHDLVLHHYPASPFAEKARRLLAYTGLPFASVEIPVVMPKPDLVALTGGYRKTPVLQRGADVYCDTWCIARVLDAAAPDSQLFPKRLGAVACAAGRLYDRDLFMGVLGLLFEPRALAGNIEYLGGAEQIQAFATDREPMLKNAPVRPIRGSAGHAIVLDNVMRLEAQLREAGPFLLGERPSIADFCAHHPLWALTKNHILRAMLEPYPMVRAWLSRIDDMGPLVSRPMGSQEALQRAAEAQPEALPQATEQQLGSVAVGDTVTIFASDYAHEPSQGTLVHAGADELVLRRQDEHLGTLHVHFPRIGYRVRKVG
ncbi:MAG: glutathione S-transferase family protein [Myxococcales bacterium]|nr:glutathione S-transferase family protein [Myxococcales bacterium]